MERTTDSASLKQTQLWKDVSEVGEFHDEWPLPLQLSFTLRQWMQQRAWFSMDLSGRAPGPGCQFRIELGQASWWMAFSFLLQLSFTLPHCMQQSCSFRFSMDLGDRAPGPGWQCRIELSQASCDGCPSVFHFGFHSLCLIACKRELCSAWVWVAELRDWDANTELSWVWCHCS